MNNYLAKPFSGLVQFPLNRQTGKQAIDLTPSQYEALVALRSRLASGQYQTRRNECLCGSVTPVNDIVVLCQDRYGLPMQMVVCKQCSLGRTDPVLDDASLASFYEFEFSRLHRGATSPTEKYLEYVIPAGESLYKFLETQIPTGDLTTVAEVGCATGANLLPFQSAGKQVVGFDFDESYMAYGKDRGVAMQYGDYKESLPHESQDLLILSHVLEHLPDPVSELRELALRVKAGGFLYVEVPGIFSITQRWKHTPGLYHQNDHIYHFHEAYLRAVFESLGLEVVYCDQWCKAIVKRPLVWEPVQDVVIPAESLGGCYFSVVKELKASHLFFNVRTRVVDILDRIGLKSTLKKWRGRAA